MASLCWEMLWLAQRCTPSALRCSSSKMDMWNLTLVWFGKHNMTPQSHLILCALFAFSLLSLNHQVPRKCNCIVSQYHHSDFSCDLLCWAFCCPFSGHLGHSVASHNHSVHLIKDFVLWLTVISWSYAMICLVVGGFCLYFFLFCLRHFNFWGVFCESQFLPATF